MHPCIRHGCRAKTNHNVSDGDVIDGQVSRFFSSFRPAQMKFAGHQPESTQLPCQLLIKEPDVLLAHFPEATFSPLLLDPHGKVFCFCAGYDELFHIDAQIDKILGGRDLQLTILDVRIYPQRRRYFRIDADVLFRYWPLESTGVASGEPERKRLNLSAVGLRFETAQFLRHIELIGLELQLGRGFGAVNCVGRVVRISALEDQQVEAVSIDFAEIVRAEQEKIIKFCLSEQRNQIRHRVRVLDLWVG